MPPAPQALCSQASPSFFTKNSILTSSPEELLHFVLSIRMGRIQHFSPPPPSFTFLQAPVSLFSVLYSELFTSSSPSAAVPSPSTSWTQEKLPWRVLPHLGGATPVVGARMPAPVDILGKEQLVQQNQQCLVPVVHKVSWLCTACQLGRAAAHGCDPRGPCCHCCKMPSVKPLGEG